MSDAIVCENLTRKYGNRTVLDRLTLRVSENVIFGFLGPNGAGKSTTMKLLTGQIKPTSGKAWVAGIDVATGSLQMRQQIGYLSELPNFYNWMSGQELLEFVGELFGMKADERRKRAKELLVLVGLSDAGKWRVGAYSGGMRQRLGIAQALVNHPKVVFLDEPVSALDPIGRRDVLTMLDNIRQEATVFMSSHVLADVDRVCEQVAILNKGQLITAGATTELKERYATPAIWVEVEDGIEMARKLADNLAQISGVTKAEAQDNGRLKLEFKDERMVREAGQFVPRLINELGLTLLSFQTAVPNLEDVFIKLVGNDEKFENEAAA